MNEVTGLSQKKIGFFEAFSLGVGQMVGGGIFVVIGLTVALAHGAAPLAFAGAGAIALLTVYSYVRLSLRYPSEGGTIEFIVQAYGNGAFAAVINNLMLMSYVVMLALNAYAFASYGAALMGEAETEWVRRSLAAGVILFFIFVNLLGTVLTGVAEDLLVIFKVAILLLFVAVGIMGVAWDRLDAAHWGAPDSVVAGGLLIFLAYEGFELIANTARDIRRPEVNLPRAYYASVLFVIALYVAIAVVVVGNLSEGEIARAGEYVIARVAEIYLGKGGLLLVGVAVLLSTASAINASLFGGGRIAYLIATLGELPRRMQDRIKNGYEGAIILGLLGILFATSFNLDNISVAGSIGFLTIFMLVNFANFLLAEETGASRAVALAGALLCLVAIGTLIGYNVIHSPQHLVTSGIVILATCLLSLLYFNVSKYGASLAPFIDRRLAHAEGKRVEGPENKKGDLNDEKTDREA